MGSGSDIRLRKELDQPELLARSPELALEPRQVAPRDELAHARRTISGQPKVVVRAGRLRLEEDVADDETEGAEMNAGADLVSVEPPVVAAAPCLDVLPERGPVLVEDLVTASSRSVAQSSSSIWSSGRIPRRNATGSTARVPWK